MEYKRGNGLLDSFTTNIANTLTRERDKVRGGDGDRGTQRSEAAHVEGGSQI